jgi:hypothetical protein
MVAAGLAASPESSSPLAERADSGALVADSYPNLLRVRDPKYPR